MQLAEESDALNVGESGMELRRTTASNIVECAHSMEESGM